MAMRQPARLRAGGHCAAHANQAGAGIARDGQFFLAAAGARADQILDCVEIDGGLDGRTRPDRLHARPAAISSVNVLSLTAIAETAAP